MITRSLHKGWFQTPVGTEVQVVGECNDAYPGQPRMRMLVVRRVDGQPLIGPDGPKTEVGVAESMLDGQPVPRMARQLSLMQMFELE